MASFSVDTKLFRELGELLVGRESTALVELVKNAYDADARLVRIFGTNLNDLENGLIVIEDDGIGMTLREFEKGFLTIAGRTKTEGQVRSPVFDRRYTGEKGVGRLSAHKLGAKLDIISWKYDGKRPSFGEPMHSRNGVEGSIDWDVIEQSATLADIDEQAVQVRALTKPANAGTRLTLSRLRRSWTRRHLDDFLSDVATLTPPEALSGPLSKNVVSAPLLFTEPKIRDAGSLDPGFETQFTGDFHNSDLEVPALAEAAFWVIEIESDPEAGKVRVAVEPTPAAHRHPDFQDPEGWRGEYRIPNDSHPIAFHARIFETHGRTWPRAVQGVRVYLEGFRVAPYGDPRDDWLDLDYEYRRRGPGELGRLKRFSQWRAPDEARDEGLHVKGNNAHFGAVFLTREAAAELKMLVNREGFVPGPAWDYVYDVVRWALGVQVRQRRLASEEAVAFRKRTASERRQKQVLQSDDTPPAIVQLKINTERAVKMAKDIRFDLTEGNFESARSKLEKFDEVIQETDELSSEGAAEAVMYRVLAAVGLEQAAFVHEILALAVTAEAVASGLERLVSKADPQHRPLLRELAAEAKDLRERLRRNGIYLAEMTGIEGRRRRSRVNLRDRFEAVKNFYSDVAARRSVSISNEIPEDLLSPPIFPAEATALFSNLLSNGVKFAGSPGKIRASGRQEGSEIIVRVENTGNRVDLSTAERWFDPFRTTTEKADPSLGQGMGLGLTVSRSLMDEYGGIIQFVEPANGFATAVELKWPKR